MRFLRDIIAKKANSPQVELHADVDLDEAEFADWPEAEGEETFCDETLSVVAPVHPDIIVPAAVEAPQIDAPGANHPQADPDEPDRDDLSAKIWELFDDDERDETDEPYAPLVEEPECSKGDLAREAMKSMIEQPRIVENVALPDQIAPSAAVPAADEQPVQRAGRVKTRMLGFHRPEQAVPQVFDRVEAKGQKADGLFPVGWLVLIEGPGRGTSFPLLCGVSTVGRGADQRVRLDFGDNSISRDSHMVIAYDEDSNGFFIGHTGKANLVRLNGRPVLSTEEIANFDLIRIGETTLRFVGFCGPEFAWDMTDDEEIVHACAS